MSHFRHLWPWFLIVSISISPSSFAQETRSADESTLRKLVEQYFAAYASRDRDTVVGLWSTRAPELATLRKKLDEIFAAHEKFELKTMTVAKPNVESDKASIRVAVEMSAIAMNSGKPAEDLGKMNRSLQFVKEDGNWKVWREVAAEEDLADALAAAKTDQEREGLLATEKELKTVELRKALTAKGRTLRLQGNYQQALTVFQFAQSIAEQIADRAGVAEALQGIGGVAYYKGNYIQALEYYKKSLDLSEAAGDRKLSAGSLRTIGSIHFLQSRYDLARQYYQKSLTLQEEVGDKRGAALSMTGIGNIDYRQGDYDSALDYYRRGLKLSEAVEDNEAISTALNNIGLVHEGQGSFSEALELYQRSLGLSQASGNKREIAYVLNRIGVVHYKQGDYSLALEYYTKSLSSSEELEDKRRIAGTFTSIGAVHFMQRNYSLAIDYYQKSLELKESLEDKQGIANALIGIGIIHRLQGDYGASLKYCEKGLHLAEALGNKQIAAYGLHNIGIVQYHQGNLTPALEYFQKSLRLKESLGDKDGIAESLVGVASVKHRQGDYRMALESAERAIAIVRASGLRESLWSASTLAGLAHVGLAQPTQARQAFDEAIATIESLRREVAGNEQEQQRFFENKIAPYHAMVESLIAQNNVSEALAYAERAKARVLLGVLSGGKVSITKTMNAQEQEQERKLKMVLTSLNSRISENPRAKSEPARLSDLNTRLNKARLEYEAFQTTLYAAHPELKARRGEARIVTADEISGLLPDARGALLEYVVTEDRTYLFVVTRGKDAGQGGLTLKVHTLTTRRKDLSDLIAAFQKQLAKRDMGFRDSARKLYDVLLKPARADLRGKTSLVIVPDNVLWELPFQALQTTEGRYLLEEHPISYAPSLTVLREMVRSQKNEPRIAKASLSLLGFGNPALQKQTVERFRLVHRDEKLEPLPEAEREVKTLGQMYGGGRSKVYVGTEAREDRLKQEAGSFAVLHLATHGILNDANPMYSQIVLAQGPESVGEDGLLEAWEIMKLDLKADLVVLSACETGRGRVGAGEGLIGLAWALFVAGSPTSVVSQWKVESASTTQLMLEFHRSLRSGLQARRTQHGAAGALREAAMKLLRSRRYSHPFYWAGFVVVGVGS